MIESIITEKQKQEEVKYPCLMEYTNVEGNLIIIYAYSENGSNYEGVCIYSNGNQSEVGKMSKHWSKTCYKPFQGQITLKNK